VIFSLKHSRTSGFVECGERILPSCWSFVSIATQVSSQEVSMASVQRPRDASFRREGNWAAPPCRARRIPCSIDEKCTVRQKLDIPQIENLTIADAIGGACAKISSPLSTGAHRLTPHLLKVIRDITFDRNHFIRDGPDGIRLVDSSPFTNSSGNGTSSA